MRKILYLVSKICSKLNGTLATKWATLSLRYTLWINGASVGKNLQARHATPSFWRQNGGNGKISIGDNVTLISYGDQSYNCRCKIMVEKNANLTIGHDTGFNGVLIYCQNSITIGNYVKVGGGTRIFDTDHHPVDWQDRRRPDNDLLAKHAPILIEDDVFIGTGCYIMKGVTIGARSVVAAGSVVTKSIPSGCIAGGNPCKVIKYLSNE